MKKILPAIFLIMVIFGLIHYFIFLITSVSISSQTVRRLYAAILISGLFAMPVGFAASYSANTRLKFLTWSGYIWMGLSSTLFFFSLLEFFGSFLIAHGYPEWVIFASAGIGIWSLFKGLALPKVITHSLNHPQVKDFKLVQLSDLHIGMLNLNEKWLKKIIKKILPLNVDAIVITGDLVEGAFNEVSPQLEVLKQLSHIPHKFFITGNHEYIHGSGPWENRLTELGFIALHNENRVISHNSCNILFAGIPDRSIRRFLKRDLSDPDIALHTSEKADYRILLAHQPASAFDTRTERCDLILSGHTHGGQIFPFHFLVRLLQPVLAGFKKVNNTLVFAHSGTGYWGPPMRWFSQSEIVLFHWH